MLALIVIFAGGYYLSRGGFPKIVNFFLSTVEREVDKNTDPTVTPEKKAEFKRELNRFRQNLQTKKPADAEAIILELNRAVRDQKITADEIDALTRRLREVNDRWENKPTPTTVWSPDVPLQASLAV